MQSIRNQPAWLNSSAPAGNQPPSNRPARLLISTSPHKGNRQHVRRRAHRRDDVEVIRPQWNGADPTRRTKLPPTSPIYLAGTRIQAGQRRCSSCGKNGSPANRRRSHPSSGGSISTRHSTTKKRKLEARLKQLLRLPHQNDQRSRKQRVHQVARPPHHPPHNHHRQHHRRPNRRRRPPRQRHVKPNQRHQHQPAPPRGIPNARNNAKKIPNTIAIRKPSTANI